MRPSGRLGFAVRHGALRNDILVPRYYDPAIERDLAALAATHDLVSIRELIETEQLELRQGKYVPKQHYGTGPIPYIRTSDIANWELRGSPKHGVSEAVWERYVEQQDVRPGDVLLVHEGTYLIGTTAPVTRFDLPLLFQHHLAKLRMSEDAELTGPMLCAAFSTEIVQRQLRARQFTADVIDSIVGRLEEVVIPIPRDPGLHQALESVSRETFDARAEARTRLALLVKRLEPALLDRDAGQIEEVLDADVEGGQIMTLLGDRIGFRAFRQEGGGIRNDVLIPAYYDPSIADRLAQLEEAGCELVTIGALADDGVISLETGDEVGKLAYGSGDVPFVRTSDLGTWELKLDPKQRVSRALYESLAERQSARAGDILVVRDGTYLVGTSAMVTAADTPLLFSGGLYRVRVEDAEALDPHLLLALLWSDVVRRQLRAKRFTRDVIDTLGRRFAEVVLPLPPPDLRDAIARVAATLIARRADLRATAGQLGPAFVATGWPPPEE
jgi:hypothetical protein